MKKLFIGLVAIFLAQVGFAQQTTKILNATTGVISMVNQDVLPDINDHVAEYYVDMFEAISIAKNLYGNRTDVDYYIANTGCQLINDPYTCDASDLPVSDTWVRSNYHWLIFVDEAPGKNWSHECGYVYVQSQVQKSQPIRRCKIAGKMFPYSESFTKVDNINRYGANAYLKPNVVSSDASYNAEVAGRTYALLLGCASNLYENYERLWNDCGYIYQVLRRKYNVPKSHIYTLIANGADVGPDVAKADGSGYMQSNCDLDGDHIEDVELPAEFTELDYAIDLLRQAITANDQLLVFVTGNAGYSDEFESYYLKLWSDERLYSQNFARKFDNINARAIHFVFGQSMAAGFVDNFTGKGRIVTAACSANEATASCADKPYTEFLYNWTSAVNGADIAGNALNADTDNNSKVTIEEAFQYANNMTTASSATLGATNQYLREDLALNNIPEDVDLYIRDNIGDTGKEPNTYAFCWQSPDIWVRNQPDGFETQEDEPLVLSTEIRYNRIYAYVRVWNRGQDDYTSANKILHLYWTNLMINNDRDIFMGYKNDMFNKIFADEVYPEHMDSIIKADSCRIYEFEITVPKGLVNLYNNKYAYINVLARISDSENLGYSDPIEAVNGTMAAIREHNDIAQHSRMMLDDTTQPNIECYVQPDSTICEYAFIGDSSIFSNVELAIELSPTGFQSWEAGGHNATDVTVYSSAPRKFYFNSANSKISGICTQQQEDSIQFSFNLISTDVTTVPQRYNVDLIKKNAVTGELITGTTITIISNGQDLVQPIVSDELVDCIYVLRETGINQPATYQWLDDNGNVVANGKEVALDASSVSGNYRLRVKSESGVVGYADFSLENVPIIKSISPNPFVDSINIELSRAAKNNTIVQINGITVQTLNKEFIMHSGEKNISIISSDYPSGTYLVSVIENGKVLGTKQIVK